MRHLRPFQLVLSNHFLDRSYHSIFSKFPNLEYVFLCKSHHIGLFLFQEIFCLCEDSIHSIFLFVPRCFSISSYGMRFFRVENLITLLFWMTIWQWIFEESLSCEANKILSYFFASLEYNVSKQAHEKKTKLCKYGENFDLFWY